MSHLCHAIGCGTAVPPRMFMCARHWRTLPKEHKDAIWREYVPGQERRKDPTDAYREASMAAVRWMARAEQEPTP
jgi:hypothetical protein